MIGKGRMVVSGGSWSTGETPLTADFFPAVFEPSSLLPANGGDGSEGFVIPRIAPTWMSFATRSGAGDVNHDGIGDIVVAESPGGPGWPHFSWPSVCDLRSDELSRHLRPRLAQRQQRFHRLRQDRATAWEVAQGTAGDVNGDGVDDLLMSAYSLDGPAGANVGGAYVLFGKNTATAGPFPAVVEVSALNGSNGFVIYGVTASDFAGYASAAGDVNGDGLR